MNLQIMSFIQTAYSLLLVILAIQQFRAANALVGSIDHRGNETDYMALFAIKSRLIDLANNGFLSSWNHTVHHCSWEGVICGHKHKRVTELCLCKRGLGGTISPFIGNLSFLRRIAFSNNSLSGQIPLEIGRLFRLHSMHLYNNSLSGEIPTNISGCVNLRYLSLSYNNLQGKLPMGLATLSNLKYFWLRNNKFSGSFFKVVANLTSLKKIGGDFNAFTGTIPDSISRMKKLVFLNLNVNVLSGIIPLSIFNLSSLQYLQLGSNQLQGSIPPNIASTLPQLQWLSLFDNYLSGPLPISIQNLTTLEVIELDKNNFTGSASSVHFGNLYNLKWLYLYRNNFVGDINYIISTLVNCSRLEKLDLATNHFNGILPKVLANLSENLVELWVGRNQISRGIIPAGISNLINLRIIDLSESNLTGTIPPELSRLQKLEELYLYSNKLTGKIPNSFKNLSHLAKLSLFNNYLQGNIPPSLGSCESLLHLHLYKNDLNGPLPRELFGGSATFTELDLSQNQLEGSLPAEISQQIYLVQFAVCENKLAGRLPQGLGSLFDLQVLHMSHNYFHGPIPSSIASLKSLMAIDLSQNNFSGPIPEYFVTFPLIYLNLSYNNFEGMVPKNGVYANASAISLIGNSRLCGGISELHLPRCMEKERKKRRRMSRALKSAITVICAFGGVLAMATFIWLYLQCHRRKRKHVSSHSIVKEPFLNVSYDMLRKATAGFSMGNLLGSGAFGSVYKGVLDGNTIAIKVLNLQHLEASKSFVAECKALRNARHRNLVQIITACSSIDFQRNEFKALVYEFMPNGSLDKWLHEEESLSLLQRVDIAIDVAHALNYLHHECENTVVHCDLKPSNILLDNELVAHVADFGLARVLTQPLHPNQSSSIELRGTVGYVAPEYGLGGEASLEADLYSYGILLLELMTRKRPTDNVFREDFNLQTYAKAALPGQVLQIVDPKLTEDDHKNDEGDTMGPRTPDRLQVTEKCIKIVVQIGVVCSDQVPHNRMKISAAIKELLHARSMLQNPRNMRNLARGARG